MLSHSQAEESHLGRKSACKWMSSLLHQVERADRWDAAVCSKPGQLLSVVKAAHLSNSPIDLPAQSPMQFLSARACKHCWNSLYTKCFGVVVVAMTKCSDEHPANAAWETSREQRRAWERGSKHQSRRPGTLGPFVVGGHRLVALVGSMALTHSPLPVRFAQ